MDLAGTQPALRGRVDTENALGLAVDPTASRVYLADHDGGLRVVDVADPDAPALRHTLDTDGSV